MRQDQWSNTVTIDGVPWGVWDTLDGGDVEADEVKHRPGGMQKQVSLGGPEHVNNITLTRLLDQPDWAKMKALMANRVGKARATVSRQPLDPDGNPFGEPLGYAGVLNQVIPGATDGDASAVQMWTILISTDGGIS